METRIMVALWPPWITNLLWLSIYRISRWFKPSGYFYKPHLHCHNSNYYLNKQLEVLSSPNGCRLLQLKRTMRLPSFPSDIAVMLVHDSPKQTRTFPKWQNHWLRPTVSVRFSPPSLSFWPKNDVPLTGPNLVWWSLTLCSLQRRLMDLTLTLTLTGTKTHPQHLVFVHLRLLEGNIGKQDVIVPLGFCLCSCLASDHPAVVRLCYPLLPHRWMVWSKDGDIMIPNASHNQWENIKRSI